MAGRRVCMNKAVAVVALLALLLAAGEAEQICKVDRDTVLKQCGESCSSGTPSQGCCDALRHADFGCLCHNYWDKLKAMPAYARCAQAIPSKCNLPNAKCH
ncbi:unnamed protein product [Miscanthus lutarioriparius]|uniref:Bifunctional inhibitor/plant lipid transfer protein/seed storage helical domain-containing protein n=1 Tax=Miscanthus lutarioriparius TaxID=422564 RepID=A0A811P6V8_9POAL|nr:unnamed protein product [Miscanthus lutarioriparius]